MLLNRGNDLNNDLVLGRQGATTASRNWLLELARQAVLVVVGLILYSGVRTITEGDVDVAVLNGYRVLDFQRLIGLNDVERWAQSLILDRPTLLSAANAIYIYGHWPAIAATLIALHRRDRHAFLVLRNALFISGAIGLVVFATFPVAPPRLLGAGFVDTVTEYSNAYRFLQPPSLINKYAAIPSFHVGWNLLIGLAIATTFNARVLKVLGIVGPMLMAIAVVVTGNHYVIDGVIGAALALVGLLISRRATPAILRFTTQLRDRLRRGPRVEAEVTAQA